MEDIKDIIRMDSILFLENKSILSSMESDLLHRKIKADFPEDYSYAATETLFWEVVSSRERNLSSNPDINCYN